MAYWLLKTEPDDYSWNDQVKRGSREKSGPAYAIYGAPAPQGNEKGDKFFFYHTGDEKQIVGIGAVIRESFPIRRPRKRGVGGGDDRGRQAAAETGDPRNDQGRSNSRTWRW
jgi:hypothetical protein